MVRGGPDEGSTIALTRGLTRMGRAPVNEIILDQPGISRQHADIRGDANGYRIVDLGSRNGTFVNGERVGTEPCPLRNLARIELGGTDTPIHWIYLESQATVDLPTGLPV